MRKLALVALLVVLGGCTNGEEKLRLEARIADLESRLAATEKIANHAQSGVIDLAERTKRLCEEHATDTADLYSYARPDRSDHWLLLQSAANRECERPLHDELQSPLAQSFETRAIK